MIQEDDINFEEFASTVEANERKEVQSNQKKSGFDFPDCAQVGNKAIVRFVNGIFETATDQGKPGSGRAKLFNFGWVKDDNGKMFPLCLPAIINNKPMYPHTMSDFIDKVLSKTWLDNPDPTKKKICKYYYAERDDRGALGEKIEGQPTLKSIFWNVFKSGALEGSQYYESQKSWRGQTIYVANVIDRLDYKWHQENKKTKLLMRSLKLKGDKVNHKEISFYAIGAPLKEVTDNYGPKLDYDVLIVPGKQPLDKFTLRNISKMKERAYWDDVKSIITEDDKDKVSTDKGFTEEEKTWETVDIDKYYRFTSAATIIKHFGKTIQAFDDMVGTDFMEKLKAEAAADKEVKEAEKAKNTENIEVAASTTQEAQPVAQSTPEVVVAPTPTPQPVVQAPVSEPTTTAPTGSDEFDSFYSSL